MRNPTASNNDSSDEDNQHERSPTHQITQDKHSDDDAIDEQVGQASNNDDIYSKDNANDDDESEADDDNNNNTEEEHNAPEEETNNDDNEEDDEDDEAEDTNLPMDEPQDEDAADATLQTNATDARHDGAENYKEASTTTTDDDNQDKETETDDTMDQGPPSIAAIVQHLQAPQERNNWREALTDASLIPSIYESTDTKNLQHTPNPTSTIQLYTNWAAKDKEGDTVAHIATGFAIMQQGTPAWMQDALDGMTRDKHPPAQLHLIRMTAADRFTILTGRTGIHTRSPSAQKDLWAGFTIDATGDEQRILFAKPFMFKAGKVISPVELVRGQMLPTGTKPTTNQSEQADRIPTTCPIPLTWAATILQHPEWTAQATAQYITSQLLLWDLQDPHVSATAELVWSYLCGALTAGSKARPTVRFRFSANPATFDPPATKFLDALSDRLWRHELAPTTRKKPPTVKHGPGRRTSGRLQQKQLATTTSATVATATATPKANATATKTRKGTQPNSGTKGDRPAKSNMDNTTLTLGTKPDKGRTASKSATPAKSGQGTATKTGNPTSKAATKQRAGTTKKSGGALKTGTTATKRKVTPGSGPANLSITVATANKRSRRTTATGSGQTATVQTTVGATAPPATPPLNTSTAALTALLQSPDILARTIGALAQAQITQANQLAEQRTMNQHFRAITTGNAGTGDPDGPTARKSKWNEAKKARFAAWANLPMDSPLLPDFWPSLIQAASDDKEAIIAGLFNGLRDDHWEFQGWEPSPQLVADIQKLVLRPPMMSESKYHRGITPMAFADVDLHELEAAWANNAMLSKYSTKLSLSTAEAMALEHKAPIQPTTVETLRLCIRRCMLFLKATLGNQCYYYVAVKDVCTKLLRLTQRLKHSPSFMQRRGPSILWELSHVSYDFFGQVHNPNEFLEATQFDEPPPKATAPVSLDHLLSLDIGPSADLPTAWLPNQRPTQERHNNNTGGHVPPARGGPNTGKPPRQRATRTGQLESAWAPGFSALFNPYSGDQRRKVALKPLLQQANKDLKWLTTQLGVPPKQCMKSTVFGVCPEHCKLTHATQPPAADKVAQVVAAFKPLVPSLFAKA